MFEILMFLFENYMEDRGCSFKIDNDVLTIELEKIGFDPYDITRALGWLDGLSQLQTLVAVNPGLSTLALRHYLPEEAERLGVAGQGLLLFLEQMRILDPATREVAIDRIMALDPREVSLGRIKWVVLLVLFNQPEKRTALILMQDMILTDAFDVLH
jgi:Smg protein